jgi:hypothetical protein
MDIGKKSSVPVGSTVIRFRPFKPNVLASPQGGEVVAKGAGEKIGQVSFGNPPTPVKNQTGHVRPYIRRNYECWVSPRKILGAGTHQWRAIDVSGRERPQLAKFARC